METKTAILSEDGKFRFELTRQWLENGPLVLFIMLNPSTADHEKDDATIRKCRVLAKNWGFAGMKVCNLFPFRATDPKELLTAEDPTGGLTAGMNNYLNQVIIDQNNRDCAKTIFAWGNTPVVKKLFRKFPEYRPLPWLMQNIHYLNMSKDGAPMHPLYQRSDTEMKQYFGISKVFEYLKLKEYA